MLRPLLRLFKEKLKSGYSSRRSSTIPIRQDSGATGEPGRTSVESDKDTADGDQDEERLVAGHSDSLVGTRSGPYGEGVNGGRGAVDQRKGENPADLERAVDALDPGLELARWKPST